MSPARPPESPRRALLLRVAALLLGTLLALVLSEAALRVLGRAPERLLTKRVLVRTSDPNLRYHCYPDDPSGSLRAAPDARGGGWALLNFTDPSVRYPLSALSQTPYCVEYRKSVQGLRDRAYAERPAPGVLRIAGVGDSFGYGEGVAVEHSPFKQMERLLGSGYEIVNAALPGIDTAQEVGVAREVVASLRCPRVVVLFIANDIALSPELRRRQAYINDLIVVRDEKLADYEAGAWYRGRSRLLERVGSFFAMRRITRDTIDWYRDLYDPEKNAAGLRELSEAFESLAQLPGARAALVLYPLMEGFEDGYPLTSVHAEVTARARRAGLPVLDLAPSFDGADTSALWVHRADHHPNARAHARASEAIIAWLREDLPGFLDR